jgi:hypothetical protein
VAGLVGGLGAGVPVGFAVGAFRIDIYRTSFLTGWEDSGDATPGYDRLALPVLMLAVAVLVATTAGRWGFVIATIGLGGLTATEHLTSSELLLGPRSLLAAALAGGLALGGALAAYGFTDRTGRWTIAAGLVAGTLSGWQAWYYLHTLPEPVRFVPLLLTLAAATVWIGRWAPAAVGRRGWGVAAALLVVTGAAFVLLAAITSSHRGLVMSTGWSPAKLDTVAIGLGAEVVLAAVGFGVGGARLAQWAVVGYAGSLASGLEFLPLDPSFTPGAFRQGPLLALAGAAVGALLIRLGRVVPWEGLALVAAAVVLWVASSDAFFDTLTLSPAGRICANILVSAAVTAGAVRLARESPLPPGTGPAAAMAALLGFGSYLVGVTMTMQPFIDPTEPGLRHRHAITLGVAGLVAIALYLVAAPTREHRLVHSGWGEVEPQGHQ